MSIFDNIIGRFRPSKELPQEIKRYTSTNVQYGTISTLSDLESTTVSEKGAMSIIAFYECVSELAETIATFPKHWYRRDKKGVHEYDEYDQATLWKNYMSEYVTSFVTIRTWLVHYFLRGNGTLLAIRNGSKIVEYVNNRNLYPFFDKSGQKWYYDYETGETHPHYNVIHIASIAENPHWGVSLAKQHASTLGRSKAAKTLANKMYTNGTFLGAAIEYPENIDHKMIDTGGLRAAIKQNYQGIDKAGEIMILTRGGKLKQLNVDMPLVDAEYIADSKLTADEIRASFKMPSKDGNTYNSIEQKNIDILRKAILPIITMIEQEVNHKCVPTNMRGKIFMKHNFEGFLRADSKTRIENYAKGISMGLYLINECRGWENLPPIEGGDTPMFAANNMLPLSKAEEFGEAQILKLLGSVKTEDSKKKKK